MYKKLSVTIIFSVFVLISFCQPPKSDFSHIEIIIDSADFRNLINNDFVKDNLGTCVYDTLQKSPLVISYYINGLQNFMHFNPAQGYFASQRGTVYLIFQSRLPGQGNQLEAQWRSVTADSLKSYNFKGPDFLLTEIILKRHWNIAESKTNHLIPMLSSYSVTTYKNWGLGDSSEVSMKDFLGGDSSRYFNKILSVKIAVTKDELRSLTAMLKVTGYEIRGDKFIKEGQPEISFVINDNGYASKVREVELLLNKSVNTKTLKFGSMILNISKDKAKFVFR